MNAVEFTTELSGAAVPPIPDEVAARLPKSSIARFTVGESKCIPAGEVFARLRQIAPGR